MHGLRPRLHTFGRLEPIRLVNPQDLFSLVPDEARAGREIKGVFQPMPAGSCTFHNGLTFHYAGPNTTDRPRRAMITIYMPDGVAWDARLVDTALVPGGQFRGYGTPQVSLAMESQVDEIAERLGIDPIDLRLRNLPPEHTTALCGYRVTTNRLEDCLVAVRDALDWDRARAERPVGRGWGVAAGSHGSGAYAYEMANRSDAAVDLFADGRVRVRHGSTDAGTGQNTILAQRRAKTHRRAADDLALDGRRVDRGSDVVGGDIVDHPDPPGQPVDVDDGAVGREGVGGGEVRRVLVRGEHLRAVEPVGRFVRQHEP